ncbi:mitochondrial carrier [Paratrimastix pyriformis]|uniref:Membrane carrier 1 n=1 Tax=Paratrimastix pyriformis TaxID=342808 RepID=B0F463_9EUKA|nr:membrane carrier 1 [Paratrimastix pyriformis]KAJ4454834.1 mitochondrial carrier [Paratrimastix pyriformis]
MITPWQRLTCSTAAALVTKTLFNPLDNLKVAIQTSDVGERGNILGYSKKIYKQYGLGGFWRGNTALLMRAVPFQGVRLTAFPLISPYFGDTHYGRFLAGALSGILAVTATYPLDVARTYVQTGIASTTGEAFARMYAQGTMYQGIGLTLMGQIPYDGIQFMTYSALKPLLARRRGDKKPTPWDALLAGTVAGLVAQTATYPIDLVKRRCLVTGQPVWATARRVYAQAGLVGFFRGNTTNIMKAVPQTAIQFALLESMTAMWIRFNRARAAARKVQPGLEPHK